MKIALDCGIFLIGENYEYSIEGNYSDGYIVRNEDGDILYDNISLENCIVWCLNSI